MVEVAVGGDDGALIAGRRVENGQRRAEGIAEDTVVMLRPVEPASLGVVLPLAQQGAEPGFVGMDIGEPATVGREGGLADRHLTLGELGDRSVRKAGDFRAADFAVLEIVNLASDRMDRREVIIDAVQMPFAPYGPAGIGRMAIGELADLAAFEVEAIELHPATALAVEYEKPAIRRHRLREIVERI